MKKVILVLTFALLFSGISFAGDVEVTVVDYGISVNGTEIDVIHSDYPVIAYNGVTYFPMTFDYLDGVGLSLSFDADTGLSINQKEASGVLSQQFLNSNNILGDPRYASIATYPITVNGTAIDNNLELYPVLSLNSITYFPMTWRFAVEEFNWTTAWSNEIGFSISLSQNSPIPETEKNAETGLIIIALDKKGEVVTIKNATDESIDLDGYRLLSVKGEQEYIFTSYMLEPGDSVRVYGKGGSGDIEGWNAYVWNNSDPDPAELYDDNNQLIYRYEDSSE